MSRTPLFAVLVIHALIAVAVLAYPWQDRARAESRKANASARHPAVEPFLCPKLRLLLTQTAAGERCDDLPFFLTLASLTRRQDWDLPCHHTTGGRAVGVQDGSSRYVVVVLGWESPITPGTDWQQLLLLDREGHLLDQLSCGISNRLTTMFVEHRAAYRTDTPRAPERDGAQAVIRYVPEKGATISGNWQHNITYAGKTYSFDWDQDRPDTIRSAEWSSQGLCRVTVRHGKFHVLFPPLEK
jgi:hypothetical protein